MGPHPFPVNQSPWIAGGHGCKEKWMQVHSGCIRRFSIRNFSLPLPFQPSTRIRNGRCACFISTRWPFHIKRRIKWHSSFSGAQLTHFSGDGLWHEVRGDIFTQAPEWDAFPLTSLLIANYYVVLTWRVKSTMDRCSLRLCNLQHFPGYFEFSANKDNNNSLFLFSITQTDPMHFTWHNQPVEVGYWCDGDSVLEQCDVHSVQQSLLFFEKCHLYLSNSILPLQEFGAGARPGTTGKNSGKLFQNVGPKGARRFISNSKLRIAW